MRSIMDVIRNFKLRWAEELEDLAIAKACQDVVDRFNTQSGRDPSNLLLADPARQHRLRASVAPGKDTVHGGGVLQSQDAVETSCRGVN